MARRARPRPEAAGDPFAPIEVALDVILAFLAIAFALGLVVAAVSSLTGHDAGGRLFSFDDPTCVTADAGGIGIEGTEPDPITGEVFPPTSSRGSTVTDAYRVCLRHPSFGEQLAASADGLLSFALLIGTALLVRRVIRDARRDGLFTPRPARSTRHLGWLLVTMSVLWPLAAQVGTGVVVAAAVDGQQWSGQLLRSSPVSCTLLLTGLGVLTFARILRLAVPLQEEAALTV